MKKWILLIPVVLLPGLAAFKPPSKEAREKAIGPTAYLSTKMRRAVTPGDEFKPIPKPGFGDWLSSHPEPGQTFPQFVASNPNKPGAQGRKFIYLQPIGAFPDSAPKLTTLKSYLEAYFHPMQVKMAPAFDALTNPGIKRRGEKNRLQLNCVDLLDTLQRRVPRDAYVVMGVTMTDLYPSPDWNFVFGMARIKNRVGVFSFARYGDDPTLSLKRTMKVISHETGHAFGIRHCIHFHCLMNGSNSMQETDRAPLHACPVCLRKLHWGLKFDPAVRYQKLSKFLEEHEMKEEALWFKKRAVMINR
ncbi:MAG: archaemetzincin [Akkermansiaceae bacterium]